MRLSKNIWAFSTLFLFACASQVPDRDAGDRCVASLSCEAAFRPKLGRPIMNFKLKGIFRSQSELPLLGTTAGGQEVRLGAFSGLHFLGEKNGNLQFISHTDRGPNPEPIGDVRAFALPDYTPRMVYLDVNVKAGSFAVTGQTLLRLPDGRPFNGLPPGTGKQETPVDLFGRELPREPYGIDPESIADHPLNKNWKVLGEEYGPSILIIDEATGKEVRRYSPGAGLPEIYASRILNRGFEGLTTTKTKIYGFLQSPLPGEALVGRIVEIDPRNDAIREFRYQFESPETTKIGDVAALPDGRLLVIERDDVAGPDSMKYIFRLTFGEQGELVAKELIMDLTKAGFHRQKAEGLTIIDRHRIAVLNDNDFQANGSVDYKTGRYPEKPDDIPEIYIFESETPLW